MPGMPRKDLNATRNQQAQQRLFSQTTELPVADLLPSPENGRRVLRGVDNLAEALKVAGMVQAMTVVTADTYISHYPKHEQHVRNAGKKYVVLHGHRRLAAAQKANLDKVPVYLRKTVTSMRIAAIQENENRLGLDPVEQGAEYQAAMEENGISQRELARQLGGTSQTNISHRVKLLSLIPELQQAVVNHWLKRNGLEHEMDGDLLLPVKEAATVLASLRDDLQRAYAAGEITFEQAAAIVKSKTPKEHQEVPAGQPQDQAPTAITPAAATPASAPSVAGQENAPLPSPRNAQPAAPEPTPSIPAAAGTQQTREATPAPQTAPSPDAPVEPEPAQREPEAAPHTPSSRGAIPITTVEAIYTRLKKSLTPEEFEQLQELILSD